MEKVCLKRKKAVGELGGGSNSNSNSSRGRSGSGDRGSKAAGKVSEERNGPAVSQRDQ